VERESQIIALCMLEMETALIDGLWVMPGQQGRGIGTALIIDAIERFRLAGADQVLIEVHPKNPAAQLYRRMGFSLFELTTRYSKGLKRELPLERLCRSLTDG
jgi:ribosomal protein S18 acetylase RimI-like enzyme